MTPELIARYDRRVPRYTSYPTAPHFGPDVDGETYRGWLGAIGPDMAASLYLHIPFCQAMCWYCGCNTKVTRRLEPVAAYADTLIAEIEMTQAALAHRLDVAHVHFGGGSPNMLAPGDLIRLIDHLRGGFALDAEAVIAVEIDPRSTTDAFIDACRLIQPATSFGGTHSSAERRARWGDAVAPGFVRLSIGCEPAEELWAALEEALDQVG